jgi:hypothetical protein
VTIYATALIGRRMVTKALQLSRDVSLHDIDWACTFLEFIQEGDEFTLLHLQSPDG